jgi:hypothetical protein
MSRWGISAVMPRQYSCQSHLDVYSHTEKCDGAKRGLLWAASRLYALDSSDDGVCARRVGNVLGGPYRDVLLVRCSHEVRQASEGCLFIALEAGSLR